MAIWERHLNAIWYILLNGIAWRALPPEFGKWGTIFQFFNRLSLDGFFEFLEQTMIPATVPRPCFLTALMPRSISTPMEQDQLRMKISSINQNQFNKSKSIQ